MILTYALAGVCGQPYARSPRSFHSIVLSRVWGVCEQGGEGSIATEVSSGMGLSTHIAVFRLRGCPVGLSLSTGSSPDVLYSGRREKRNQTESDWRLWLPRMSIKVWNSFGVGVFAVVVLETSLHFQSTASARVISLVSP